MDDLDVLTVDKFVVVQKNQKPNVKRKSGGIAALTKINLYKHIDRDCEYVLRCKLDKALSQTDEDFYFRTVYMVYVPAYICYSQTDLLEQFYYELESFTRAN